MRLVALLLFSFLLAAEVVDRLAITVGQTIITELQIDEDIRVAALLNGQPINRDLESRRTAADRLVEQLLIKHEIELSRYPPPPESDVSALYSRIEQTLGGADKLEALLHKYDVSAETLRSHLVAQLAAVRFIEVRFTPDISISDNEIEAAYLRQVKAIQAANPGLQPPLLDANEHTKISKALVEERTTAALDSWLAESRKQVNIVYVDPTLQ